MQVSVVLSFEWYDRLGICKHLMMCRGKPLITFCDLMNVEVKNVTNQILRAVLESSNVYISISSRKVSFGGI